MLYHIVHTTTYTYEDRVSIAHNLAHLLPRSAPRHVWLTSQLAISPHPATRSEHLDFFGNRVTFFAIQEPHHKLSVTARGDVELSTTEYPGDLFSGGSTTWETLAGTVKRDLRSEYLHAYQYVFDSPHVRTSAALKAYAEPSFPPGRSLFDALKELNTRIHEEFTYDSKATTIATPLDEVLAKRRGVCQDFAHLMIGCLRSLGLPARYVSGYLLTTPPPGKPRLIGADASHAWVGAFIPELGWVDFDPTNDTLTNDKHITLAWGRDFADISPLRGVILGGGQHSVSVSVDVSAV